MVSLQSKYIGKMHMFKNDICILLLKWNINNIFNMISIVCDAKFDAICEIHVNSMQQINIAASFITCTVYAFYRVASVIFIVRTFLSIPQKMKSFLSSVD